MEKYNVSVVIPAYNAEKYISRAVKSVLAQTRKANEIIIVDDGSTDGTANKIRPYGTKIKYIRQENAGPGAARNTGIQAAGSEWIAFLDADDEWLPENLYLQMNLLQRNSELVWAAGNYHRCLCGENRRSADCKRRRIESLLDGREYLDYFSAQRTDVSMPTCTVLVQRKVLEEAGLFRIGQNWLEDLDMWWRIAYRHPQIGYVSQPIAVYHLEIPQSLMQTAKDRSVYRKTIEWHLQEAAKFGKLDEFKPCASFVLRRWMRSMLFEAGGDDIRDTISQFDELLPEEYKKRIQLLTACPRVTAVCCHIISRLVRLLRLRRRLLRRPAGYTGFYANMHSRAGR